VNTVVTFANPTGAGPDISLHISANTVRATGECAIFICCFIATNSRPLLSLRPSSMSQAVMFFGAPVSAR